MPKDMKGRAKVAEAPTPEKRETEGEAAVETKEKKEPVKRTDIVRGRMPVVIVYMVKFGDNRGETVAAKAKLFGTTTGKIDDLVRERGFKYVKADFAPTVEQKADGIEYFKKHPGYAKGECDKLIDELESYDEATPEQAKAFETVRASVHGQGFRKKTGEVAEAGGGNKRTKPEKSAVTAAELTE